MRPKCGERNWTNKNMNYPPPGTYNPVVKINSQGKYPLSTISNIKSYNFGLSQTYRWNHYNSKNIFLIYIL